MAKDSLSTIIETVMSAISRAAYHPGRQDVYAYVTDPTDGNVVDRQLYICIGTVGVFAGPNENQYGSRIGGVWSFTAPTNDVLVYLIDEEKLVTYTGTEWKDADIGILADVPPTGGTAFDAPAAAGIDQNASRHDHVHEMAAPAPNVTTAVAGNVTASAEGSATAPSRSDHVHGLAVGVVANIAPVGTAASAGTSSAVALADHVHAHAIQIDPTLHALAIALGNAGFLSGFDKDKLDNIAPGAEVNPLQFAMADITGVTNDLQHGDKSTGSLHALAAALGVAGFMSGADKDKLDNIAPGAEVNPTQFPMGSVTGVTNDIQHGTKSTGDLHALAIAGAPGTPGFISGVSQDKLDNLDPLAQPNVVTTVHGRTGAIVAVAGDYDMTQVSGAITALQHATQTDPLLHAVAVSGGADGFMSGADKATLDTLVGNPGAAAFAAVSTIAINNQPIEPGTILQVMDGITSYGAPTWTRTNSTTLECVKDGLYSLNGEILIEAPFAPTALTEMFIKLAGNPVKVTWFSLNEGIDSVEYGLWFNAAVGDTLIFEIGQAPDLSNQVKIFATYPGSGDPAHGTQLRLTLIQ